MHFHIRPIGVALKYEGPQLDIFTNSCMHIVVAFNKFTDLENPSDTFVYHATLVVCIL